MADHYYSKDPQSAQAPKTWTHKLRNQDYIFSSDAGVFSRNKVDFGSELLIETFHAPDIPGTLLDLGCGYGPIGVSLAESNPDRHVLMVDINERAVELARKNAKQNGVENVEVFQSDQFSSLNNHQFAAIVTNPPIRAGKKLVHSLFAESKRHLHPKGELWIVIQKKQGAPSAIKYLASLYTNVDIIKRKKGYYILRAKND